MKSIACTATALAICAVILSGPALADGEPAAPVFTRDVAPILHKHCVVCHRPGEVAPMALRTYDEVRPWAKSMKTALKKGQMPPWFSDAPRGTFANDPRLTDQELETILRWIDSGAPRGNPKDMPDLPEYTEGWQLGEPDYVVDLPEVQVPADGPDYFPDLQFDLEAPERRWVRAVEVRPGNRAVNHHVVLFAQGGRGMRDSGFFDVLAVWGAGSPPTVYPEGMGRWVSPGQRITTNMHYHPNGEATVDQTRVGLYFGEGALKKEITAALAGSMTFEIPAGVENHPVYSSWIVDQDIRVVSFFPHMHLRGKSMKLSAHLPNGDVRTLLNVPEYDFDWQLFYYPREPMPLPRGTRIDIEARYDNSAGNPDNPDPTRDVGFGLQSTDEMSFGLFEFIPEEGVSVEPVSTEKRISALLDTLPEGEVYRVEMQLGRTVPTALHLPPEGDGMWYIPFRRQLLSVPVQNVHWDGQKYTFGMTLSLGPMKANLEAEGQVNEDGSLEGAFSNLPQMASRFVSENFTGVAPS